MPRGLLVLCVDDELNGLEGRKILLEEAGFKVLVATSGASAATKRAIPVNEASTTA
jgi:CheY-like chemotaxis protein